MRHRQGIHAILQPFGSKSLPECAEVVFHAELFLQAAKGAVDRVLRPRLAFGVQQQRPVRTLLAEAADDLQRPVCAQVDDAVSLLALRFFWWEYDAALLQIDMPGLNDAKLLRP